MTTTVERQPIMVWDAKDNVAMALEALPSGTVVWIADNQVILSDNVRYAHKFAWRPIKGGEYVVRRGEVIGLARADIQPGELVHLHNLLHLKG